MPSRYDENVRLGKWVETQRYEYTKLRRTPQASPNQVSKKPPPQAKPAGVSSRLTPDRQRRLEAIGFEWKVKNKMKRFYDKQWDQTFDRLLEFKKLYGHTRVPKSYAEDPKLGSWAHSTRSQYRKIIKQNTHPDNINQEQEVSQRLTEGRRKRLSDIGFEWDFVEKPPSMSLASAGEREKSRAILYDLQTETL